MLNDIRLTGKQLALLHRAAEKAGAELIPAYRGAFFAPANDRACVALRATSPGQLVQFAAICTHLMGIGAALLVHLAARAQEDMDVDLGTGRVYYWPGILAAGPLPEPVPAMLTVAGQRFACERCGANVFTRTGEVFACNGCGTEYAEPAEVTS